MADMFQKLYCFRLKCPIQEKTTNLLSLKCVLLIMIIIIQCLTLNCPVSSPTDKTITSNECSFSAFSFTWTHAIALGPVSKSLYYMYSLSSPGNSVIRKLNPDESYAWMAAVLVSPIQKSLSLTTNEQYVYFGSYTNPMNVCRINASDGTIYDAQTHSSLQGQSHDIKINILSDNSGYIIIGRGGSSKSNICKYLYSSPTSSQCQQIVNFPQYSFGQLMLSDSSFFILSNDPISPYPLHFYSISFSLTAPTWSMKMSCPSGTCDSYYSSSILVSSKIISFFAYGSIRNLYYAEFSPSNGSILSSRYKSSISCTAVYGAAANGDYIIATTNCGSLYLIVHNTVTSAFEIKTFSGDNLYGCEIDSTSGRFVVGGHATNAYVTKFMVQAKVAHPDFSDAAWTMDLLTSGTDNIIVDSGQTIGSITSQTVSPQSYTNQSVTYVSGTSYTSTINFMTSDLSISVVENNTVLKTPDLPCLLSGSTPISFGLSNYFGSTVPSWITIDPSSGDLTIIAPSVSIDTEFDFYIDSNVSGVTGSIQKLIKLTILDCVSSNCNRCSSTSNTICELCSTGYILTSGSCNPSNNSSNSSSSQGLQNNSSSSLVHISKAIDIMIVSIVSTVVGCVVIAGFMNSSSIAALWMTIIEKNNLTSN